MRITLAATVIVGLFITGCATDGPQKTSLELQAFQKREFATVKQTAFASTVSVFQDLGYTIRTADVQTGLIQAQSPTKNVVIFGSYMSNTEATAFVEEIATNRTTVRLNFVQVNESSSSYGMKTKNDKAILTPAVYENAFGKIQEAIFIRTNNK